NSVDASPGTQATFSNASGATVSWTLNTLDSNSSSTVHINVTGMLPAGSPTPMSLTLRASLTADGVAPGDAVATATVMLNPSPLGASRLTPGPEPPQRATEPLDRAFVPPAAAPVPLLLTVFRKRPEALSG